MNATGNKTACRAYSRRCPTSVSKLVALFRARNTKEEMMSRNVRRLLQMIGVAVVVAAPGVWAQEAPPVRVRGTIERLDGSIYVVKNRDGAELRLTLADKPQ